MQEDVDILWQTYQQVHPSYNWYAPADSVDARFKQVRASLTDSLTEPEFRLRLSYATAAIQCGHTSILPPKSLVNASRGRQAPAFPLNMRVWGTDSMIVTDNLGPSRDSVKRGVAIISIDSVPAATLIRQMQEYISKDGFHNSYSEAILSASFASRFRWMYGIKPNYDIEYIDSSGQHLRTTIRSITPRPPDSTRQSARPPRPPAPRPTTPLKPRIGYLEIDSNGTFAYLRINTFSGKGVSKLIRQSFETIEAKKISQLIVDIRDNGGGRITKSALLGRYLANESFKVGDSISAKTLKMPYPKYVQAHAFYQLFGWMIVKRKADGRLHFGSMERKVYKPKKAHHFDGNLYVLTSGRSFSASILFLQHIANRPNKIIVGEETGGTARGNSAVMTPDITLPNTHIRARLPLFRLITRTALPQNGRGVLPDVMITPNSADIRYRKDAVLEAVKQKIAERK
jgi:hypothetical protein